MLNIGVLTRVPEELKIMTLAKSLQLFWNKKSTICPLLVVIVDSIKKLLLDIVTMQAAERTGILQWSSNKGIRSSPAAVQNSGYFFGMTNSLNQSSELLFTVVRKCTFHCVLRYSCVCRTPYKNENLQTFSLYLFVSSLQTGNVCLYSCLHLLYLLVWNWSFLAKAPLPHFPPWHSIHLLAHWMIS